LYSQQTAIWHLSFTSKRPTHYLLHACKSHPLFAACLQVAPNICCMPRSPTHIPLSSLRAHKAHPHSYCSNVEEILCTSLSATLIYNFSHVWKVLDCGTEHGTNCVFTEIWRISRGCSWEWKPYIYTEICNWWYIIQAIPVQATIFVPKTYCICFYIIKLKIHAAEWLLKDLEKCHVYEVFSQTRLNIKCFPLLHTATFCEPKFVCIIEFLVVSSQNKCFKLFYTGTQKFLLEIFVLKVHLK
jgi:hypothetical protein